MNRFKEIRIDSETCQECGENVTGHRSGICEPCRTVVCVKCRRGVVLAVKYAAGKKYTCKECGGERGKKD